MYTAPDKTWWQGRVDAEGGALGMRWHQRVLLIDLSRFKLPELLPEKMGIVFLGFACDEGVRRNKGRTGAKEGPAELRRTCANLADHLPEAYNLYDGGTISCEGGQLEEAQKELDTVIQHVVTAGYLPLVFGGGHEVAFPHFTGLFNSISREIVIGIVNIDAHFDLRISTDGSTSGTPFSEIADICQHHSYPFHYFCIGIQAPYNTKALFQRAQDLGVGYLSSDELQGKLSYEQKAILAAFIHKCDKIYLTICLDVFDISFAPGVSAPSASGISPSLATDVILEIRKTGKLLSANIAELNPSLDQDLKTARLAARMAYEILSQPPILTGRNNV